MPSSRSSTVFVVSPPDMPRARRLADELYELGWDAIVVDSPSRASRADDAVACVVVLTRDDARDPAIVAALRAKPSILIPVLMEPMSLPPGPWTAEPLEMRMPPADMARRINTLIEHPEEVPSRSRSRSRPQDESTYLPERGPTSRGSASRSYPPSASMAPGTLYQTVRSGAPVRTSRKKRRRQSAIINRLINLVVVALILGGLYFGYRYTQTNPSLLRRLGFAVPTATVVKPLPYAAVVPGSDCDKGGGKWLQTTNTNFAFVCQQSGLEIDQKGAFDQISGIVFQSGTTPLTTNYHAEATVAIQSNEPSNAAGVIVHPKGVAPDKISGGQLFLMRADGAWSVKKMNDDGTVGATVAFGYLNAATKNFALGIDLSGPTVAITINGNALISFADPSFGTAPTPLAFVITNNGGSATATAAISKFAYTPLPAPTIAADSAIATVTAQNAIPNPYKADAPGPGCDKGRGQWLGPGAFGQSTTLSCTNGMTLSNAAGGTQGSGWTAFYGLTGTLPGKYSVEVKMDVTKMKGGCGTVLTHMSGKSYYQFAICSDGSWDITLHDDKGLTNVLNSGYAAFATTYDVIVTENGADKTFSINGKNNTASDGTLTNTDSIGIGIVAAPGIAVSASFSGFVFTPGQ